MERLPHELFTALFELLERDEIASLRLVSKNFYNFATPFLFQEIHFIFKPESFKRMEDMSRHPFISKQITSILYEADTLTAKDRTEWEGSLITDDYRLAMPRLLGSASYEQAKVIWRKCDERRCVRKHHFDNEQMNDGWKHYQRLYGEQQKLIKEKHGSSTIKEAIARLPNVRKFCVVSGRNSITRSEYLNNAFKDGLHEPSKDIDDKRSQALAVPQLRSVLMPMHATGIKLQVFECTGISWRLFQCSQQDLEAFGELLANVRRLKLFITTIVGDGASNSEASQCRQLVKDGRLKNLLSQARDIEDLDLRFDIFGPFPATLTMLIGDHKWPRLRSLTLSMIEGTIEEWMSLLERHKSTLRKLRLVTICLSSGEWPTFLSWIRSSMQLQELRVEGRLFSDDPPCDFDLGVHVEVDERFEEILRVDGRRLALQDWFINGGPCPMTNDWSFR